MLSSRIGDILGKSTFLPLIFLPAISACCQRAPSRYAALGELRASVWSAAYPVALVGPICRKAAGFAALHTRRDLPKRSTATRCGPGKAESWGRFHQVTLIKPAVEAFEPALVVSRPGTAGQGWVVLSQTRTVTNWLVEAESGARTLAFTVSVRKFPSSAAWSSST